MTPQEVIDIAKKSFDVAVTKDDEDLKKQAIDFYESVIECAKKAMIVDQARELALRIKPEDIPWKVEKGGNGDDSHDR